jgi:hypothetical protein
MDFDNVIVDADGHPWRIDNGGGLFFRAQGDAKPAFDAHVSALWNMRAEGRGAAKIYGDLGWFDIVDQIGRFEKGLFDLDLSGMSRQQALALRNRRDTLMRLAETTNTFRADGPWTESYLDMFSNHWMNINIDFAGTWPKELSSPYRSSVALVDENGRPFDALRGPNSQIGRLAKYMTANGGDFNVISAWADAQGGSSWSNKAFAVKWHLAQVMGIDPQVAYWLQSNEMSKGQDIYTKVTNKVGQSTWDNSHAAWHAFNYEFVSKVQVGGNDIANGSMWIIRTEAQSTMQRAGLTRGSRSALRTQLDRPVYVSGSMVSTVSVKGGNVTLQNVPHTRIYGAYPFERSPGSNSTFFLGDGENEVIFLPTNVPFYFLGKTGGRLPNDIMGLIGWVTP